MVDKQKEYSSEKYYPRQFLQLTPELTFKPTRENFSQDTRNSLIIALVLGIVLVILIIIIIFLYKKLAKQKAFTTRIKTATIQATNFE